MADHLGAPGLTSPAMDVMSTRVSDHYAFHRSRVIADARS